MKFPKLFKKAAALVMAAVTTFSVLPATTAFAAGDIGTISFDFTYDRNGNAMRYNSSAVFDGYTAGGTGSYKYRMYVDGDDAFCIQPGVPLKTGNTLKKNSSQTWNALSSSQKKAVGLALLYGYQGNRSHLSGSDDEKWLATQTLVWEFVTGCRESTGAYQQTSQKAYSLHFGSNYPNSGAAEVYNQIVSLLSKHNTITAAEDIYTLDGTLRASKGEVVDTITTGADGTATSKELYLGSYEVKEITAPYGMVLNDEIHSVELIYAGQEVAVTETSTSFYNERQKVEIDLTKSLEVDEDYGVGNNGEIFDVSFGLYAAEELTAADGTTIPADGLIEVITLDENGHGKAVSDLPMGSYYVQEINTNAAYLKNETKYPVVFEYAGQETAVVSITANEGEAIENDLIYGAVSGKKSDEDGNALGGALIGIFKIGTEEFTTETAIATTTSEDDGSFSFAKVPYGNWIIREIESPTGYVLSDEEIPVTIRKVDEVVEIELVNEFITGSIELTKVDEDYPDNKLTGAVFEVYADKNGDGKLDDGDELLGEMGELGDGVYQMSDLRYGKYLVREKTAPEGFLLDENVYPVSIEEDGKVYTVENEAGVGFINAAQKGSLKIVKTSSDKIVEGFSFRVTGTNGYDQTFKTDKNGEIFIERLRIGEYTVSEVSDSVSSGYILPADKQVTIKVDETATVEMHNELRETPKTGDDFNPALWIGLAAVSVLGAGVLGFVGFKNKKKKED